VKIKLIKNRFVFDEIQAQGNLYNAYQTIKILMLPKRGKLPAKLGIEIRLIPIIDGKEVNKYRPRSFYVSKNELKQLDRLIMALIEARFFFAKNQQLFDPEFTEEFIGYFMKLVKKAILKGLEERDG
jgi:hypothetical protein